MFVERPKAEQLLMLMKQCKKAFLFVTGATLIVEVLSVAPILYMMNMFDRVMASRSEMTMISLTVIILATYAFWSALEWLRARMLVRVSMRIDWDLASAVYDASFRRYIGRKQVNVHQVLGDLLVLRQFLTGSSLLAVISAPFAVVFIAMGAFFHPYLAIFSAVATAMLFLATYITNKATTPLLKSAGDAQVESNRLAAQNLRLAETTLGLGMQDTLRKRWYKAHQGFLGLQANASEAAGVLGNLSGFLMKAFPSLQLALGVWLAIEGLITGGMVMAASFLISKSIAPLQKVLGSWKEIASAKQAYARLDELLIDDLAWADKLELPAPVGKLDVIDMTVTPPGAAAPVLHNLNFSLVPGDALAVIGASASGKSTLTRMLIGLWPADTGHVRLDGAEIHDWARSGLGAHVGYLPQDVEFFEGTVAENIARMGAVESDKVIAAAKLAGVHDTILTFPQGYETRLSETGHALTGGQRQRLGLARAMYGLPNYLVLDEPNASLDDASERQLIQTIAAYRQAGKTVVFTTHRPALLAAATKLLVLAGGKQTTFGPAQEILSRTTAVAKAAAQQQEASA